MESGVSGSTLIPKAYRVTGVGLAVNPTILCGSSKPARAPGSLNSQQQLHGMIGFRVYG